MARIDLCAEPWMVIAAFRFPFVRPRIPSLSRVERHFQAAREAGFFSNFGPVSAAFEAELRETFFPEDEVVACASCTTGLSSALIALRVDGPVLIPAFTFAATCSAVLGAGLRPVIGDVLSTTAVLDPAGVGPAVREHGVRAVIAVRPYGVWSDLSGLADACRAHDIPLVIDNAAGLGVPRAVVGRYRVPGAIEVFSLHATKPFGIGEGGAICCPPELKDDMRSALNFGLWGPGRLRAGSGLNGKMDELSAAMARTVMEDWPERRVRRRAMAAWLNEAACRAGLETACPPGEEERAPWQCFPLRLPARTDSAAVVAACSADGLQLRRYYHPALTDETGAGRSPAAADLAERAVCLPIYDCEDAARVEEIGAIFLRALDRAGVRR